MVSNWCPFSFNFIFGKRKKSQGAKLGKYSGWEITIILFFARNWWVRTEVWDGALSWWSRGLFSPQLGAMSSHFFPQSPQNFAVEPGIHSSACWDRFFVQNPLYVKESDDHALEIAFHLSGLFWPWWRGAFPLGGLSLCLRVVTVNPALITSDDPRQERFVFGGELMKFSADDTLLLLVSCQDPGHKFGCDTVHAQFFRKNPLACTITNFHLLSNVANGQTSILTDQLLNSCNSFRTCESPCVFVVNWCVTSLELGMPLKYVCTTQALVPEALLNHFEGLRSTFPKVGTKSDAHLLFLSLNHRENRHGSCTQLQTNARKNRPRHPTYMKLGTLTH